MPVYKVADLLHNFALLGYDYRAKVCNGLLFSCFSVYDQVIMSHGLSLFFSKLKI